MEWTADFVEKGYNNRAAVPEFQQWLDQWVTQSAAVRAALQPTLDLRYGPGPKETLDLYTPRTPARGTLVFVHGGYWRSLDKAGQAFIVPPFVERGYAVAMVNYDLCPDVTIATIVDQVRRAVTWLQREGGAHDANVGNMVVAGHSAGGHLVAMLYATDWQKYGLAQAPFAAGLTLSGLHDLRPLPLASVNVDLKLDDGEATRLSPALVRPMVSAPLLVAVGGTETTEFVRQSQILWDAWPDNRPAASTGPLVVPDRNHFSVVVDLASAETPLAAATLALLERRRG